MKKNIARIVKAVGFWFNKGLYRIRARYEDWSIIWRSMLKSRVDMDRSCSIYGYMTADAEKNKEGK